MSLDFRSKFLMSSMISMVCISGTLQHTYPYVYYLLITIPFVLLIWHKKYKFVIFSALWILFANILIQFILTSYQGVFSMPALIITGIVLRMLPGSMMCYYALITTTMSDMVQSLKNMKLPDMLIIPISVMFRFFYSTREDYQSICEAMQMHGLTMLRLLPHPVRLMEYKLVPLLMVVIQTADNVAISAMTRGMRVGHERTSISLAKLRFMDYVSILGMLAVGYVYVRSLHA